MATPLRGWLLVYVLFSIIASRLIRCVTLEKPPLERVRRWSENLSEFWNTHVSTLTGIDTVERKFEFPRTTGNMVDIQASFVKIDPAALVRDMSLKLKVMLDKKMAALQNSVEKAEEAAASHIWDGTLNKEEVKYKNAKDMMNEPLAYTERFEQKVNFSFSSVHIPVEIFDGDLEILNGLNWTAQLDKVFEENYRMDPEILWQYFGSQAGFMRTYPGSAWKERGQVDLYDVRRQSWYTQGSSSPKDMMILIDTSGSTHGQALQLMKVAVKSILDTLGENDFVNIAAFSSDAQFVSRCFNHTPFVQATYRNKQKLSNDVNNLLANGMANFEVGLKFAFEQFESVRNETSMDPDQQNGASCNKVIMLLTDGGTDNAEEVFKEYNWPNKTVRVFTYAVGPTANPTNAIRWMACANRGYFSQIPAMDAIRTRVQEYIPVLSRPQVLQNVKRFVWGSIYYDYLGLGMMTTVTLPVYNRTAGSSNQTILGVMGIDVTTADMVKKSPTEKLGHTGYSFAINPNGYIIFHPLLKPTKYMRDPPNVDLLEIEIENEKKNELRTNMIKAQNGSMEIETFVLSSDMKYVHLDKVRYSYTPIEGTSFSLGVSLPSYQTYYPEFNANIGQFDKSMLQSENWAMLIAPWDYYDAMSKSNRSGTTEDIIDMLKNTGVKWDEELLNHLYWDAVMAKTVEEFFIIVKEAIVDTKGHIFTFMSTNGGLTRVFPKNASSSFMNNTNPKTSHFYKRVLSSDKNVFFIEPFSRPVQDGNDTIPPDVTIGKAFTIKNNVNGQTAYKPGMMGAQFMYSRVISSLHEKTAEDIYYDCADVDFLNCYLVDEGGFLIASNQEDHNMQIGQFLGKVDPPVMTKLFNASVYERIKHYDYQVTHDCSSDEKETSALVSLRLEFHPSTCCDALTLNWWTSKFFWAYLNFNFWNSWFSPQETYANDESWTGSAETCVEVMYQYYYGANKTMTDTAECDNCTRTIQAVRMDVHTNLLLVVADPICSECDTFFNEMPQAPVKVNEDEEKEVICDMARTPRYRKPVQGCYSKDPREDASKCGCMSSTTASMSTILLSIAAILCSVPYLTQPHS
ncbi:LOW QUALITY PROTEIN: voltage-dependent calcium channel subunit alpha-2/delta-2-like [Haliotis rubra]|uniref:LOW QUALITY PROTEIN: voltage-dependent calcium channel subunit alpha-2/delta-2-like n=1 Tax=Haliotis rubra TaxID=36100 RepID=UPI001EE61160|nr:LOW QUALITY PROTEIN: voltage-dependent calcium channel subunit alpha-2/delta-2-like [Haliotis rubra]